MKQTKTRRRTSSGSTLRATLSVQSARGSESASVPHAPSVRAELWIHDDNFSPEDVLINDSLLEGLGIREGSLLKIFPAAETSDVRDFQSPDNERPDSRRNIGILADPDYIYTGKEHYLCLAKFAPAEFKAKQANLEISIKRNIATAFGFRPRSHVRIVPASFEECTASHVEFSFRDTYLARSDMWRLVGHELAGRTVYTGQKITYMGTIKLTVKTIHVQHHRSATAFFAGTSIPVFRSEAARYVLFLQMSSEMWDFDSEGGGEIMFNRVINGFLPELFKRWTELEVRHLVSIVLFGRLEYDKVDLARNKDRRLEATPASGGPNMTARQYQDFYRVVVTDMASAQWTTILEELKKDFRVFLRDISLHTSTGNDIALEDTKARPVRIAGRPSTAMKGNILEAMNIASTQFAHDFEDRDLIRTGVSIVVVTAGTGVFEVNRDLLNLTSQNLTNNGVGIDIVCLSKMPLHSVPLFKYRSAGAEEPSAPSLSEDVSIDDHRYSSSTNMFDSIQPKKLSPAVSSTATNSMRLFASFISGRSRAGLQGWSYGIPQWIDLSYWSADVEPLKGTLVEDATKLPEGATGRKKDPFVPRVRMYEIQMMGLMELGMADMSVPYLTETQGAALTRFKRRNSQQIPQSGSRSLSHSPTLSRKSRLSTAHRRPSRPDPGLLSTHAKAFGSVFDRMDEYDSGLFQTQPISVPSPTAPKTHGSVVVANGIAPPMTLKNTPPVKQTPKAGAGLAKVLSNKSLNSPFRPQLSSLASGGDFNASPMAKKTPEAAKVNRTLSYALRGLAPPVRALASTEVNITHAQAFGMSGHSRPTVATTAASVRSVSTNSVAGEKTGGSVGSSEKSTHHGHDRPGDAPSKPISINTPLRKVQDDRIAGSFESDSTAKRTKNQVLVGKTDLGSKQDPDSDTSLSTGSDVSDDSDGAETKGSQLETSVTSSVPKSTLPFVRNVNASNPLKRHPERESFFGRWQHLYPRKPRAATVKWRSLCTPASVPLTTDDFPTRDELEMEYDIFHYEVELVRSNELLEEPESRDSLLREMLALRFAHGYQLVVGPALLEAVGPGTCDSSSFFTPNVVRPDGSFIFMSMGNTLQKILLQKPDRLQVTKYIRKSPDVKPTLPQQINYFPNIRTILARAYKIRDLQFNGFSEQYPWETADKYLAEFPRQLDVDAKTLRFWRARFVLIPVEPPANSWRPALSETKDSEEEIHLRGIRALTQMWQRGRWVPPDERRPAHNRLSTLKRKDRNPLRINLETLNPSELVATELDKLIAAEEGGELQTTQLLPEAEQFERGSYGLQNLAQALQGENGIEIKTRRWHWKLHYSCFMGEDLTNWLVHNFRDIDTREEAVEIGNDLMKEDLFEHVNDKHNFKDGNYFYSVKPEFRTQQADAKQSWFPASRRSDRSIPPTPATEHPSRDLLSARSRSGSNLVGQSQVASELAKTLGEKKRRTVTLSKMIRIDVDTRKRSNRPEIVNLHYDRLHNPENCYHLELAWLNVTSKLVDDAIVSWTTQAEKYGLKLVEVPIAEAVKVPEHEPFRAAHRIKLALDPPRRNTVTSVYFTAVSFVPQAPLKEDIHLYQKALLKHFNFVLDLEAPSEFPENVEIKYSWGDLDYRYTQFVHRSGVCLAQITDEGDLLLLANRLYNSRQASSKETSKFVDNGNKKKDTLTPSTSSAALMLRPQSLFSTQSAPAPSMQASGIIGLNVQSPHTGPYASPLMRPLNLKGTTIPIPPSTAPGASTTSTDSSSLPNTNILHTADRVKPHPLALPIPSTPKITADVLLAPSHTYYVTPEQIKDDLNTFCSDSARLEEFYKAVTAMFNPPPPPTPSATDPPADVPLMVVSNGRDQGGGGELRVRTGTGPGPGGRTGSSVLRAVREVDMDVHGDGDVERAGEIPEFRLPEARFGSGLERRGV